MFSLYRVLCCNFANSSQICKTFLGLISCKCCNIVFFLSPLYVVFIFPPSKCKYLQVGKSIAFDFSHHGHTFVMLYVQFGFMWKIYAPSGNLFTNS